MQCALAKELKKHAITPFTHRFAEWHAPHTKTRSNNQFGARRKSFWFVENRSLVRSEPTINDYFWDKSSARDSSLHPFFLHMEWTRADSTETTAIEHLRARHGHKIENTKKEEKGGCELFRARSSRGKFGGPHFPGTAMFATNLKHSHMQNDLIMGHYRALSGNKNKITKEKKSIGEKKIFSYKNERTPAARSYK